MRYGESKHDATSFALLLLFAAVVSVLLLPEKSLPLIDRAVDTGLRLITAAGDFVLKLLT